VAWVQIEIGESESARIQLQRAQELLDAAPEATDVDHFLNLDLLIRAIRADAAMSDRVEGPSPQITRACVDLALRLLEVEQPDLAEALEELVVAARSGDAAEGELNEDIDRVQGELERSDPQLLPGDLRKLQQATVVARVLVEAAYDLHRAGRVEETLRLSRKLEALAEKTLEPSSASWLYFLWRAAQMSLRFEDPELAARAQHFATRLQKGLEKRFQGSSDSQDDPDSEDWKDHWMAQEAQQILDQAQGILDRAPKESGDTGG
jgi:hypothetical protein